MKKFELIEEYIPAYEDTGVTVIGVTADSGLDIAVFDLSDGTHWFSDNSLTCRVSESLVDCEVVYDEQKGWVIARDDGTTQEIEWLEDAGEWTPVAKRPIGRYDYEELRDAALAEDSTQVDIDRLGEWFQRFDSQDRNGEHYTVDQEQDINLYPVYKQIDEYEYEIDHWSFDRSDIWSMVENG